jgi:oligosaccharide repeat unit polymerase
MKLFKLFFTIFNVFTVSLLFIFKESLNIEMLNLIEVYSFFIFVTLFILNIKIYGYFHIINIFHFTFFVFLYGQIVGHFIGIFDITEYRSLIHTNFEISTIIETILIISLSLLFFNFFSIYTIPRKLKKITTNIEYVKLGKSLILFNFPIVFYKYILEYYFILKNGYTSFFLGAAREIDFFIPFIDLFSNLFFLGYLIFIAGAPDLKTFRKFTYIFLFIMILDSLKGSRSTVMFPILFYFWYLSERYGVDSRKQFKKISIFFICAFILSFIYIQQRSGLKNKMDVLTLVKSIPQAATSTELLNLYIENKEYLPKTQVGYIFSPIIFPYYYILNREILQSGQNYDAVKLRGSLNHSLTYFLNADYYLSGGGLGSSYIVEMYEFGYFGVLFFSALLSLLMGFLYSGSNVRIIVFFTYIIAIHIMVMPRAEYFVPLWDLLKYSLLLIFVLPIYRMFTRLRKQ